MPAIITLIAGCSFLGVAAWAFLPSLADAMATREALSTEVFREAASHYAAISRGTRLLHFGLVAGVTFLPIIAGIAYRRRESTMASKVVILPVLATMVFFTVAPCHFANPLLLIEVVARTIEAPPIEFAQLQENWATYLLSLLLKSSPLVGAMLLAGLAHRFFLRASMGTQSLALITLLSLWLAISKTDFSQIFYVLPTLPILVIFGADSFTRLAALLPKTALAGGIAAIGLLGRDLALCIPDYNLNGYQYLGSRYVCGRSSLGYVSVATLPNDGASQIMDWAIENIPMDPRTLAFIPSHQLWAYGEANNWRIQATDGSQRASKSSLGNFDYVLSYSFFEIDENLGLNIPSGEIYSYRFYDRDELERDFEKIFSVQRRFGIEAGSVWRRKALTTQK